MNLNLTLFKTVPLVTLIIVLLSPTNIAKAASSALTNKASTKQETLKGEEHAEEHHGASGIPQLLLSKKAQKIEFFTLLSLIGASIVIPELLHKPKPKLKNNLKNNSQSLKSREEPKNQRTEINKHNQDISSLKVIIEREIPSFNVITEHMKRLNSGSENSEKFNDQEKIELESQSEKKQKAA